MNLRKYFLYCLSFSLVFAQSTAFGFVANNTNLNKVEYNTELNKSESHENYVKYSHTESALIVKNEQTHCAIPIHEELQREIELNLPEIQKQNKAEFPTDTQIADNEQDLTVCPPELAQELLDQGYGEMQYSMLPNIGVGALLGIGLGLILLIPIKIMKDRRTDRMLDRIDRMADRIDGVIIDGIDGMADRIDGVIIDGIDGMADRIDGVAEMEDNSN